MHVVEKRVVDARNVKVRRLLGEVGIRKILADKRLKKRLPVGTRRVGSLDGHRIAKKGAVVIAIAADGGQVVPSHAARPALKF